MSTFLRVCRLNISLAHAIIVLVSTFLCVCRLNISLAHAIIDTKFSCIMSCIWLPNKNTSPYTSLEICVMMCRFNCLFCFNCLLHVQISPISYNVVGSILHVLGKNTDTAIVGYRWTGVGFWQILVSHCLYALVGEIKCIYLFIY